MLSLKIKGGIYGVAVGDALGATVEFMSKDEIRSTYGKHTEIIGGGWLNLREGEFTDDTQMTIDVAEGIIADSQKPIEEIGERFIRWYKTNPKDIGNTIRLTLENFLIFRDWEKAAQNTRTQLKGKAGGNGCLMRTLPVTFAYYEDLDKMDYFSAKIASMTHYDQEALAACVFYNRLAAKLIKAQDKFESFSETLAEIKDHHVMRDAKGLYLKLLEVPNTPLDSLKASGYVVDTLVAALVSFLKFEGFEETVVEVVNLGDDADTVGAVVGGLAGTFYGFDQIPKRWVEKVKGKPRLNHIIEKLQV